MKRLASLAAALLLGAAPPVLSQGVAERMAPCFACHGPNGHSQLPLTPSLGGQPAYYVIAQLFLFRDARRGEDAPGMQEAAKTLTNADLRAFGEAIARLPPPAPPAATPEAGRMARGAGLAAQHHCGACHNPDYSGRDYAARLAHQREDYLLKTLRDYKRGTRMPYSRGMEEVVATLQDADLADLAHYLAHYR